jgi:hypothetical protein
MHDWNCAIDDEDRIERGAAVRGAVFINVHREEWVGAPAEELFRTNAAVAAQTGITRRLPPGGLAPRTESNPATLFMSGRPGVEDDDFAYLAAELTVRSDYVADFHGTRGGADYPFCGPGGINTPVSHGLASLIRSDKIVVCPLPTAAAVLVEKGYVGFDLSPNSPALEEVFSWFPRLARGEIPPRRPMTPYFLVDGIREAEAAALGLDEQYGDFEPLPQAVNVLLGVSTPLFALSFDKALYSGATGYRGEVVTSRLPNELAQQPEWRLPDHAFAHG